MDLLFTLRIARLNPPRFFTDLVFLGYHIVVLFIFSLLYIDMIYLCYPRSVNLTK